jgi:hypothetical protein
MRTFAVVVFALAATACATSGGEQSTAHSLPASYSFYATTFASDTYPDETPPPPTPDDLLIVTTPTWEAP